MAGAPRARNSARLWFAVISSSLGCWFPCGYSMCIYNTSQRIVLRWIRAVRCGRLKNSSTLTDASNTTSLFLWCKKILVENEDKMLDENTELNAIWALIGATIPAGAFIAVWLTNFLLVRFGCKGALLIVNLLGVIGTVLTGICDVIGSYEAFILGRFIIGMHIGLFMSIVPLYIAEISPPNQRGTMGTVPGLTYVVGALVGTVFGLPDVLGTMELWRTLTLLRLVPAALLFTTLPFCAESPRYLIVTKQDIPAGRRALLWLRNNQNVDAELAVIEAEAKESQIEGTMSIRDIFRDRVLRTTLLLCMAIFWGAQFTGINALILYSTSIFGSAGMTDTQALYGSLGLMAAQILAVFLALLLMDRAGRRILLLAGNIGCMITCIFLIPLMVYSKRGCYWCHFGSVASLIGFIVSYNLGPNLVTWILVSELFPSASRKSAVMIGSSCCYSGTLVVVFMFPLLQTAIGEWTFVIFAALTAASTLLVFFCLIETKGKSFELIQEHLHVRFGKTS